MSFTLRQFEYFVAVVKAGSITRASEILHVTPTAISLQIKLLEDLVHTDLLIRHSRGIVLTETGEKLHKSAVQLLDLVRNIEQKFQGNDPSKREIRLGVPPGFARLVGVEIIQGAKSRLGTPNLRLIEGWTYKLEQRLIKQELDCLIGWDLKKSPQLHITPLVEDHFVFAHAPGSESITTPIPLLDVLASPLVFYGKNSVSWRASLEAARIAGVKMASEWHVESISIWRNLLCRGLGTSILSVSAIADEYRRGEVAIREISGLSIKPMIEMAIRAENRNEPWAHALSLFLRDLILTALSKVHLPLTPQPV